jgi:hypothetical protein
MRKVAPTSADAMTAVYLPRAVSFWAIVRMAVVLPTNGTEISRKSCQERVLEISF